MWIPLLLIVGVFVALSAAVILILWFDVRTSRMRAETFKKVAEEMGFEFQPQGITGFWADNSQFDLFQHGHTRWFRNVMHGKTNGIEVCIFDYQYTIGSARHPQCCHQTAIGFHSPDLNLPDFGLWLKAWRNRLEQGLGYKDIEFESHEQFSRLYQLCGNNEATVRRVFTQKLLDYFTHYPGLNVEVHGNRLLVYCQAVRTSPVEIRKLTEAGFDALAQLRSKIMAGA